jgi:hypothetical protein
MRTNDIDISEESQRVLSAGDLNQAAQRELVVQWQRGFETISGETQWKLHLTLARSPSPAFATANHYEQP